MRLYFFIILVTTLFSGSFAPPLYAQHAYHFGIITGKEACLKTSAALEIGGTLASDTINIRWSTGEADTRHIINLPAGDYSVNIKIKRREDSLVFVTDTTLHFSVNKEMCRVTVDKYFSPNDDNYHDVMSIMNVLYYPNFELNIFNKWGQQVHSQKKEYIPWNGKWNGIDLPDGTYYYVFFYDSNEKTNLLKGDVTILR